MMHTIIHAQECDATGDAITTNAGYQKNLISQFNSECFGIFSGMVNFASP